MNAESFLGTLDPAIGRIVKQYLEAVERGENPAADEWIARHPEFSQPLREFFASREQLDYLVGQTREQALFQPTLMGGGSQTDEATPLRQSLKYFGDYELVNEIARGGMGVIYRARQVSLNRPVAVKMILSGELASPDDVARFRTEAEAAANLDHPVIVPIYEIGECDGQHYFSMKLIEGESLSQRLAREAGPPQSREQMRERVKLVAAACRGIHYAHQRGIIHRDLKPANVLIDSSGKPHVTDFGLARQTAGDSQLTRTGAIVGTPSYMAPEQALGDGKRATTAVDIYGLGAILYACLTGRPPLEGATPVETILKVQREQPASPSKLAPGLDGELDVICLKCLEKDPEARYRSAGELADDLDRWLEGEPIHAAPPNPARLLWRWLAANFRAAACVLLVGIFVGLIVCEPVVNMLAHNLGGYAVIYRGSFPRETAPWVLRVMEVYPRWVSVIVLPILLLSYFGMGWLTDRLVKPADLAGALLSGLGVGSVAATTAFLVAIGWQTINQVAVWPSQADLELLVAEISGDTTFSDGQKIATRYPGDIHDQPVDTRYVMKKALADLQARLPLALWYGFLLSGGLLLLPATLQTVAAQYLRSRGDPWWRQIWHLLEMSVPSSLMLVGLGMLVWNHPLLATQVVVMPLVGLGTLQVFRGAHVNVLRAIAAGFVVLGLGVAIAGRTALWTNEGGMNLGLATAGAVAAIAAVVCRFRWWQRLMLYALWFAAIITVDSVPFGTRGSQVPGVPIEWQLAISIVATVVLVGLTLVFVRMRSMTGTLTRIALAK